MLEKLWRHLMAGLPTIVVTISRQLGSGGSQIAQQVARELHYKYLDREILREAARLLGQAEADLSVREERSSSLWERIIRAFTPGAPEAPYVPPPSPLVPDKDLFEMEANIIRDLSERHNAVIVGRGAVHILKGRPGLVNVFIHAPRDLRVKRVMEIYRISEASRALAMIEKSDEQRQDFIKTMTGANWVDARNYHLSINTQLTGFRLAGEFVIELVKEVERSLGLKD